MRITGNSSGNEEKETDLGYVFQVDSRGFDDGLGLERKGKKEYRKYFWALNLKNWVDDSSL